MKRIAAAVVVALAGCANTTGTGPTESVSGFDGARVVNINGHAAACRNMLCPGLGAQWSSARPESVIVTVHLFNEWRPITSAKVNVGGRTVELKPLAGAITTFSKPGDPIRQSNRDFSASLALVRELAADGRSWLRVGTPDGYIEDAIIDGPTDSKALHALRRFLAQVDRAAPG